MFSEISKKDRDKRIRALYEEIKKTPEAQFLIQYKGRALPATFDAAFEIEEEGERFLSLNFWDGNTGNLFDLDYRLVPETVFIDGKSVDF